MWKAVRLNAVTYPSEAAERDEIVRGGGDWHEIEGQSPDDILSAAHDCDALLVVASKVPASVIDGLSQCRIISRLGAGTDKIDIEAATRRGIVVTNVPDFCVHEQAEHTFALLLAFARRLPFMMNAMRTYHWSARNHSGVHRLAGQTIGLVGFGSSAQSVARLASAFGMRTIAWARSVSKYQSIADKLGTELVSLEALLGRSDFVSLHVPLSQDTYHLLTADRLALMRSTSVLINTARGALIDERALVEALKTRRIAGAALDVFEEIDVFALPGTPTQHPLLDLDNVILTPHCAGSSVESASESKVRGARQAADVLAGRRPPHIVNQDVAPRFPLC